MKKFVTYSVVVATIAFSLGLGAIVPVASAAYTPATGDLIKTATNPAVYYIDSTGARRLFSTRNTFGTWYNNFNGLKVISQADFDTLQSGANVVARPGVNLVKFDNSGAIYAVSAGAVLHVIPSSAVASALYGSAWASRVITIQSSFEANYSKTGSALSATSGVADGSLIKYSGSEDVYYIDGGKKRLVTSEAFVANNFRANAVITVPTTMTFDTGTSITAQEAALANISGTSSVTPTLGGLTVALASSNPVSASVVSDTTTGVGQALVPFLAVNLTASSQGDVKVTSLKFERTGISADTDLVDFYLYDGATRLADGGSLSTKVLTFNDTDANGIITIPAGTTKTVVLKGDMEDNIAGGKTIGFNLTTVTSNASATNASYPVVGNLMTTAAVTDLGYASLTALATPSAATDVNAGETGFEVGKVILTANDQDLQLQGLRLTSIGTISKTDLANIKLNVSGTTLATATFNDNMELFFDLSGAPYTITKGGSKTFSVVADIVGGSTKTFKLAIEKTSDVLVRDTSYGVNTLITGTVPSRPSYLFTVSTGAMSVTKDTTSASGSVSANATNIKIATFKFTASGEDIKVKTLNVQATTSNEALNGGLQNGKVFYNGVQVGSTKNLTENTSIEFTLGSSMIVPAGTTKLVDVYADIKTTTGTAISGGNFTVTLVTGADNAQGMTSLSLVDVPSSDVAGNNLSVSASSLTVAKYTSYGNQTLTSPSTGAKIGSFTISAAATEGVNVSSIAVGNATSGELSNVKLMVGTTQIGTTKDVLPSANSTSTFSISNLSLAAGETKVVDILADIKSGLTSASIQLNASAEGTTPVTNTAVSSTGPALQTITIGSGSLASASVKPLADIVIAGTTVVANAIEFSATNDAFTVTNLRIDDDGANDAAAVILSYKNKAGATVEATQYLNSDGNADFSNLAIYVAKNGVATVTIKAMTATIASGATSGGTLQLNFAAPTGTTFAATGETSGTVVYTGPTVQNGNAMIVRASKPSIELITLPSAVLSGGTNTIAKFKISADMSGGKVIWKQIAFQVTTTTGVDVTDESVSLYKVGDSSNALNSGASLVTAGAVKTITVTTTDEQSIPAGTSQIYELKADITGTIDGSQINTKIKSSGVVAASVGTSTNYSDLVIYETGFAWSDSSASPHISTSRDWADSTYVKSLPTDTQNLKQ